ncbi:MAG: tRNA threonylcarbamoyladenosine dehydratase [Bacilli bacterium]
MLHQFSRNELAFGQEGLKKLSEATVVVLGVGGVGSFSAEALVRSGVGRVILIDKDVIDITNVNRQIHATLDTVGQPKVEVMKQRMLSINPHCDVITMQMFYNEDTYEQLFAHQIDWVIDASDTISYKIHIIKECIARNIQIISSMGAANKLDPTRFRVVDLFKTTTDPIAKVMRTKLRKEGVKGPIPVVFSDESPVITRSDVRDQIVQDPNSPIRKSKFPPSSNAFVPSVAGLIAAAHVINDITKDVPITRVGN